MSPEHVYDSGLLQNSTHSRASHSLSKCFWIAHSVRDDPYINSPSSLASIQSMDILYFPMSFHQTKA